MQLGDDPPATIAEGEATPATSRTDVIDVEPMELADYARFFGTIAGFMVLFYAIAAVFDS